MFEFIKGGDKEEVSFSSHRLRRMILEMVERGEKVFTIPYLVAISCEDGLVLLDLNEKGCKVCMVKHRIRIPDFYLNLTEEQMQAYNGGKGIRGRFTPYKEQGGRHG